MACSVFAKLLATAMRREASADELPAYIIDRPKRIKRMIMVGLSSLVIVD
jgi:hypothetical protein